MKTYRESLYEMFKAKMETYLFTFYVFLTVFKSSSASGYFEFQLLSMENIHGELSNGDCCGERTGPTGARKCLKECATMFKICLKHYQAQVTFTDSCTFGNVTSTILGGNSFSFALNTTNSVLKIPFEFSWTRSYTLIVTALDSGGQKVQHRMIERSAYSGIILPGNNWHTLTHHGSTAIMVYRIRVRCNENFYNTTCSKFCRPHNDRLGHYRCNKNGDKVCMDGWLGADCDFAICKTGCHALHGSCEKPGECRCAFGWEGELCDQCITYPGCLHGSCHDSPWTCYCNLNWGGILCDKDLNYCRLRPCLNNGLCMNIAPDNYKCVCPAGFTGNNCEIAENPCESNPCQQDSICVELSSGYVCNCMPGWTGRHCETDINDCKSMPCLHSGSCIDKLNGYECFCPQGWQGPQCQLDADQCEGRPCVNAHTCKDLLGDYECDCQLGWSGKNCDNNIDDCNGQCENGGQCVDLTNDFYCICLPGFEGKTCQTEVKECDSNPCLNGATCIDNVPGYSCHCAEGYSGYNCQIDTDPCTPSPCYNDATCYVTDSDYFCYCTEMYMGKNCEQSRVITVNSIDSCTISIPTNESIGGVQLISSGICGRHGLCISKPGGHFDCSCSVGYTGSYCHKNVNDCASQPCQNSGTCVDLVNSFQCICNEGWEGALCNINKNECDPNPCRNNGRCIDQVASYFCECTKGWKGRTCILRDHQCDNFTCANGGRCLDLGNTFSCLCPNGWEGNTCHLPTVRGCDSSPCSNNGTCVNSGDSYTCMCPEGFEGPVCQHNVNDCNPFPCYNGGRCIDGVNRFFCECVEGFSGPDCRVNINECLSSPCTYGSTCIDGIGEYKCICPPERAGDRCQKVKGQIPAPQSCIYKRRTYHDSVTWEDDCKRCECTDGTINCEQLPCGPDNCAVDNNMTASNKCGERETCVISTDQVCFSPPCMPWGECKPKDMIIASAASQSQHICVPEAPVFDPNCAKITLKFDMSKVPLSVTVDELCSTVRTLPQLLAVMNRTSLLITCTMAGHNEIQIFMSVDEDKRYRDDAELRVMVDAVVNAISQKRIKSPALQAVIEVKVETAAPSDKDKDPAYLIPLACSIIGLLGMIAILLLFLWHCQKKKVINKLKLAAQFARDNTTNENKNNNKNLRRYRNPLYETDKGGGTTRQQIQPLELHSSDRYEIDSDKYNGSPTRLLAHEHSTSNEWTDNFGSPCKTKVKDINVELHKTRSRTRGRDFMQMMRDIDLEDNEVIV